MFDEVRVSRGDDGVYQIIASNWSSDDGSQTIRLSAADMTELGSALGDVFDGKYDKKAEKKKSKDVKDVKGFMGCGKKGCSCGKDEDEDE